MTPRDKELIITQINQQLHPGLSPRNNLQLHLSRVQRRASAEYGSVLGCMSCGGRLEAVLGDKLVTRQQISLGFSAALSWISGDYKISVESEARWVIVLQVYTDSVVVIRQEHERSLERRCFLYVSRCCVTELRCFGRVWMLLFSRTHEPDGASRVKFGYHLAIEAEIQPQNHRGKEGDLPAYH